MGSDLTSVHSVPPEIPSQTPTMMHQELPSQASSAAPVAASCPPATSALSQCHSDPQHHPQPPVPKPGWAPRGSHMKPYLPELPRHVQQPGAASPGEPPCTPTGAAPLPVSLSPPEPALASKSSLCSAHNKGTLWAVPAGSGALGGCPSASPACLLCPARDSIRSQLCFPCQLEKLIFAQ